MIKALSKYAIFTGRSRRREYWSYWIFFQIVAQNALLIATQSDYILYTVVFSIIYIVLLIPMLSVKTRRMHDVGSNGWFQFIPLYSFYLCLLPGDPGTNKYGEDPLDKKKKSPKPTVEASVAPVIMAESEPFQQVKALVDD